MRAGTPPSTRSTAGASTKSIVPDEQLHLAQRVLRKGRRVQEEAEKVVEEEGTAMTDFVFYLKAEFLDAVYLQQDAFDPVDGASSSVRQRHGVFLDIHDILAADLDFTDKDAARSFFQALTQVTRDWNPPRWRATSSKHEARLPS